MKKKTVVTLIGGLAALALLGFLIIKMMPLSIWAETLSEADVRERVSQKYGGEITELVHQGDQYDVELVQETGVYKLTMDAKSGEILSMKHSDNFASQTPNMPIDQKPEDAVNEPNHPEPADPNDPHGPGNPIDPNDSSDPNGQQRPDQPTNPGEDIQPAEPNNPSPEDQTPQQPRRITANEAGIIAVNEIGGYVDDIDLEEVGGTIYYMVEVEFSDDTEAEVQIDVLTGEIISIVWDD